MRMHGPNCKNCKKSQIRFYEKSKDGQGNRVDVGGHRPQRVLKLRISISVSGTITEAASERARIMVSMGVRIT
jgi:hypothetical protein